MLFDRSAKELVRLLAVPVRPASTPAQTRNGRRITTTQMASHNAAKDGMKKHPKRKADSEVDSSLQHHK